MPKKKKSGKVILRAVAVHLATEQVLHSEIDRLHERVNCLHDEIRHLISALLSIREYIVDLERCRGTTTTDEFRQLNADFRRIIKRHCDEAVKPHVPDYVRLLEVFVPAKTDKEEQPELLLGVAAYEFHRWFIPQLMMDEITPYIQEGKPFRSSFLQAVFSNDLYGSVVTADETSRVNLPAFCGYLYNEADPECFGSEEKYRAWIKKHADERESRGPSSNGSAPGSDECPAAPTT